MFKHILIVMFLTLAVAVGLIAAGHRTTASENIAESGDHWQIKGALSEACTCNVPCTCNFGEGPSPHAYCYAVYSYEIKEGSFNGVKLDGLRFGAIDAATGSNLRARLAVLHVANA